MAPSRAKEKIVLSGAGRTVALAATTALLGVLLSAAPLVLEVEEAAGLGWLFGARGPLDAPSEVAVVSLSADSAEALGVSSDVDEWPRGLHAQLIDRLSEAGASVIVFDIIFDSHREDSRGDERLADSIEKAGNVVLLERVRSEEHAFAIIDRRILPIEPFLRGALATAPFTLPRVPIRVNQFWTFGRAAGDTPSLPATVLHAYALRVHDRLVAMIAGARPELASTLESISSAGVSEQGLQEVMRRLRALFWSDPELAPALLRALRQQVLEADEERLLTALVELYAGEDSRYLNFYGPAGTIRTLPYHEVIDGGNDEWEEAVEGRVVFVGFFERRQSEQQDEFFSVFSERSGQSLSGVEIGATAFANLLRGEPIAPVPLAVHWVIVALWGIAVAAISLALRSFAALAAALVAASAYAAAVGFVFRATGLWAPLVVPLGVQLPIALLAGLSWNYRRVRRQREHIQGALGYYLPAAVVDRLAHETSRPQSSRELVFGTCLVTDAEQYTTLSEALHPAELGELMDAYYDVLVGAIDKHGGVVSDIGGDSMVAVWPATEAAGLARRGASRGALEVLAAVEAFNRSRVRQELPTRIGLDSGQLLLGNVGASRRGEYRAVGDIVNTAARLQGLNRLLGTRILLSAATAEEAAGFAYRPLGKFLLVGKRTPVSVLELQQAGQDERARIEDLNQRFAAALSLFQQGDWLKARAAFVSIAERFPGDGAAGFFIEQCDVLGPRYPAGDWNGVVPVLVK